MTTYLASLFQTYLMIHSSVGCRLDISLWCSSGYTKVRLSKTRLIIVPLQLCFYLPSLMIYYPSQKPEYHLRFFYLFRPLIPNWS